MISVFYERLKDKDAQLVATNFTNHLDKSRFMPTISDLVKQEPKESRPYIPSLEETIAKSNQFALEYKPTDEDEEKIALAKEKALKAIKEGQRKHEQRINKLLES